MATAINDPIETLIHFKQGKLRPLRFLWKGHSYKAEEITTSYKEINGGVVSYLYTVKSKGSLYELVYNLHTQHWKLTQVTPLE